MKIASNSKTKIEIKDGQLGVYTDDPDGLPLILALAQVNVIQTEGPDGKLEIPTPEQVGILLNGEGR